MGLRCFLFHPGRPYEAVKVMEEGDGCLTLRLSVYTSTGNVQSGAGNAWRLDDLADLIACGIAEELT